MTGFALAAGLLRPAAGLGGADIVPLAAAADGGVAVYDRSVLTLCGLGDGYILSFGCFTRLVQERILSPGLRPSICGGCQRALRRKTLCNSLCTAFGSRLGKEGVAAVIAR